MAEPPKYGVRKVLSGFTGALYYSVFTMREKRGILVKLVRNCKFEIHMHQIL